MTEYQYIESKMNVWDHYGATWAFVWPVVAILALVVAGIFIPERQFHLENPLLRGMMLMFLLGLAVLIASRTMWVKKQGKLKNEFKQNYTNGGG